MQRVGQFGIGARLVQLVARSAENLLEAGLLLAVHRPIGHGDGAQLLGRDARGQRGTPAQSHRHLLEIDGEATVGEEPQEAVEIDNQVSGHKNSPKKKWLMGNSTPTLQDTGLWVFSQL